MHARLGGLPVMGIEDFCEEHWSRVPVEYLRGEWFAFAQGFALVENPLNVHAKRASDIALALLGMLLAAPIMLQGGSNRAAPSLRKAHRSRVCSPDGPVGIRLTSVEGRNLGVGPCRHRAQVVRPAPAA
jgi:hypothetical protein